MGRITALGIDLRRSVNGVLQNAQKLWRDLFSARYRFVDRGSRELSGNSFQLMQDFGCFHWRLFAGAILHSPTITEAIVCQNQSMPTEHTWTFKPRLRAKAFGWQGSHLVCQRLKEAVTEIKRVDRVDPVSAGDGVVALMERIWPAFQDIDTSSGALGGAVYWAQIELTRDKWLERLWQTIEDDADIRPRAALRGRIVARVRSCVPWRRCRRSPRRQNRRKRCSL